MRLILFLLILTNWNYSFAQKRKKNKEPFPYSYTVTEEMYQFHQLIDIQVSYGNGDTIVISGNSDTTHLKGNIYFNHYSVNEQVIPFDSSFQVKINLKTLNKKVLLLDFDDFENYEENHIVVYPDKIPYMFTINLEGKTAFDPETGYIYIHSKNELSQAEIDEIIRCIGLRKEEQSCYDNSKIYILFAI